MLACARNRTSPYPMVWKYKPIAVQLKKHNAELASALTRVREQLRSKECRCSGLEMILRERLKRIDELNGKIEQLRDQNRRLDEENEHLVEMVRLPPLL